MGCEVVLELAETIVRVRSIEIAVAQLRLKSDVGERIGLDQRGLIQCRFGDGNPAGGPFKMLRMEWYVPFAIDPSDRLSVHGRVYRGLVFRGEDIARTSVERLIEVEFTGLKSLASQIVLMDAVHDLD